MFYTSRTCCASPCLGFIGKASLDLKSASHALPHTQEEGWVRPAQYGPVVVIHRCSCIPPPPPPSPPFFVHLCLPACGPLVTDGYAQHEHVDGCHRGAPSGRQRLPCSLHQGNECSKTKSAFHFLFLMRVLFEARSNQMTGSRCLLRRSKAKERG